MKDSDHVVLTHIVQVQNEQSGEWYQAFVDASSGEVVNLVSFVADASVGISFEVLMRIYSQILFQ